MDFRDEPAKVAKTKATKKTSTRKDSGAARKVPNQTTLNESVKRTRDALLDEIQAFDDSPWGDSGDDDYVDTRPGNVPAPVKRPKRASTAAGGAATINNASPAESCLEELRKLRKKVCTCFRKVLISGLATFVRRCSANDRSHHAGK